MYLTSACCLLWLLLWYHSISWGTYLYGFDWSAETQIQMSDL